MLGKNILEHTEASRFLFLTPSSKELDLKNNSDVDSYFNIHRPEIVIHCAGKVGGIQANIKEPVSFLIDNFEMGRNVLTAARKYDVQKCINMASSCMYPKDFNEKLTEEMILEGKLEPTNEGYALAKISVMKLGQYIDKEDQTMRFKTLIPCNLYGRWDKFEEHHSHMIPAVIKKIGQAKNTNSGVVEIWGDGLARREFMPASEVADFTFFAIQNWETIPELINVGTGIDYTINEYYKAIAEILMYSGKFEHDLTKPVGMKRKLVDVTKAASLGWKAKKNLHQGLIEAIQFYKEMNL